LSFLPYKAKITDFCKKYKAKKALLCKKYKAKKDTFCKKYKADFRTVRGRGSSAAPVQLRHG